MCCPSLSQLTSRKSGLPGMAKDTGAMFIIARMTRSAWPCGAEDQPMTTTYIAVRGNTGRLLRIAFNKSPLSETAASSSKAAITPKRKSKSSAALLRLIGAAAPPPPSKNPGTHRAGRALAPTKSPNESSTDTLRAKGPAPSRRLITPAACTSRPRKEKFELALRPRAPSTLSQSQGGIAGYHTTAVRQSRAKSPWGPS
jgi:hypothetical protein